MLTLATDVQKIIIEYLNPKEIKKLYETCKVSKIMFEELTKHTNFIIDCKEIITNEEFKWFELKNIKIKLLETYIISKGGDQHWYKNGKYHRDNDLPAAIYSNGVQHWYQNGRRHRDNDLPAVIRSNGQEWYKNGSHHRDNDLPAVINLNGSQYWYKNGFHHRDNNLPAIIYSNGDQIWYKNGLRYFP